MAQAKVEGDTIILGPAISLTGMYSTNNKHAKNGYEFAGPGTELLEIPDLGRLFLGR